MSVQIDSRSLRLDEYNSSNMVTKLGRYIEQEVEQRGWSYRELARRARVSPPTVLAAISGENQPKPETLRKLARALDATPEHLFQLAGILRPPRDDDEITVRDAIGIMRELTPEGRRRVLEFLYFQLQQERQRGSADTDAVHEAR